MRHVKIRRTKADDNPNYLGWDEDHDGDWNDWFMCPACKENNYIKEDDKECTLCGAVLEWIDDNKAKP